MKIKEIAEALNLSTATVSRVLNEKAGVHPATKDRILGYMRSLEEAAAISIGSGR